MDIAEEKTSLRSLVLARRDRIPLDIRAQKSANICAELLHAVDEAAVTHPLIAVYGAMRSEVDLDAFIQTAYEREWRVAFPCMMRQVGTNLRTFAEHPAHVMRFLQVPSEAYAVADSTFIAHPLKSYSFGDGAIAAFPVCPAEDIDVVIVPMVAFDDARNRLGYGGGNYDRFLPHLRDDTLVIGVAFDEQRVDAVPIEPHDQPLPRIVSA